ncbi:MAG: hypothetical protein GXP62_17845, partial [Oligoflexia bacterium]|nr:hypothetical protein [Oligoflexia bacterium]
LALTLGLALVPSLGHAQDSAKGHWKNLAIQPKRMLDGTAYTLGQGRFRAGLFKQSWGALDNVDLSTNAALWLFGLPNLSTRITAIQTPRVDLALRAGVTWIDLQRMLDISGGRATLIPVGFTGSVVLADPLSVHLGGTWNILDASGEYTTQQLAQGIATATGTDINPDLLDVLQGIDQDSSIYAGAHVVLTQSHLGVDLRLNRRDSIIFRSTTFLLLKGTIQGGYSTSSVDGATGSGVTAEIGPSARLTIPLADQVSVLSTLSYQASWRRLHLRVGLPLVLGANWLVALPQAFSLHWLLGPLPEESVPEESVPEESVPQD